jgi:hypothetical protein
MCSVSAGRTRFFTCKRCGETKAASKKGGLPQTCKTCKEPRNITCDTCGKVFFGRARNTRYCSTKCVKQNHLRGQDVPCAECGEPVYVHPSRAKSVEGSEKKPGASPSWGKIFCGDACRRAHDRENGSAHFACLFCGKKKTKTGGRQAGMYCSKKCYGKAKTAAHKEASLPEELATWAYAWDRHRQRHQNSPRCRDCGGAPRKPNASYCEECWVRPRDKMCTKCGCAFVGPATTRMCKECVSAGKKEIRKKHKMKSHSRRARRLGLPSEPGVTLPYVWKRDKGVCRVCGVKCLPKYERLMGSNEVHPRSPTVDHVVPLSDPHNRRHGHTSENTQLLCYMCNSCKNDAVDDERYYDCESPRTLWRELTKERRTAVAMG